MSYLAAIFIIGFLIFFHELGHLLGYPDLDASLHGADPMAGALGAGLRRMPLGGESLDTAPHTEPESKPTRLDDRSSQARGAKPLAVDREALFAEFGRAASPTIPGALGRRRRKERRDARNTRDEVFASWKEV